MYQKCCQKKRNCKSEIFCGPHEGGVPTLNIAQHFHYQQLTTFKVNLPLSGRSQKVLGSKFISFDQHCSLDFGVVTHR